jgi:hypothetical protein
MGPRAKARTSLQPTGRRPQPIASAIGRHMAMTTGDSTRFFVSPIRSLPVRARDCALPSLRKAAEAGLVKWACRAPASRSSMSSPEPWGTASTWITLPEAVRWPPALKRALISLIHSSFSEP